MDPIGEILRAVSGENMNGWGALAIACICAAWAFAQYLRFVHHAEERAARANEPAADSSPPQIKPPGTAGLLLLLLGIFGLAVAGLIVRGRVLEHAAGVAGAAPSRCTPATCKPPSRCTADGCTDAAGPHGELAGDPPWAATRGPWDGRAPWIGGGS